MLYPWQDKDYSKLVKIVTNLPHALLINSIKHIGVEDLLQEFIAYLMCLSPQNNRACGVCNACLLYKDGAHPDYFILDSLEDDDKKSKNITIDQIRRTLDFIALSSHIGRYKVVFIKDTSLLNQNSANSLLKTLEEPPQNTLFILLSYDLNRVLPTIKSRCYKYNITPPSPQASQQFIANNSTVNQEFWLGFYANAPLYVEALDANELEIALLALSRPSIENIYALSKLVDGDNFAFFIEFIAKWVNDLTSMKMHGNINYFIQQQTAMQNLATRVNSVKIFELYDRIVSLMPWGNHPLNYKLQIENLLFKYQGVFSS